MVDNVRRLCAHMPKALKKEGQLCAQNKGAQIIMIVNTIQYTMNLQEYDISSKEFRRALEDALDDFQFSSFNYPQNIMPMGGEVPLMLGLTVHGHAQIQLTRRGIHLLVRYDENYWHDLDKCFSYACTKIERIKKLVAAQHKSIRYEGLIAQYIFPEEKKPIENFLSNMVAIKYGNRKIADIALKICFVDKDRFFTNFSFSVLHTENNSKDQAIGVVVDINNRYGVENCKSSDSDDDLSTMVDMHREIVANKLEEMIKNGKNE